MVVFLYYIANLGKYNEGELVGDWFSFPLDEEVIAERIGLNAEYEEYAIHDTDNFPMEISEYTSIEELNRIYEQLEELPDYLLDDLDSFISCYGSLEELVEHKDDIILYSGCETHVGIYVGNNQMYHAGNPIGYTDLTSDYWQQHIICAGRIKQ